MHILLGVALVLFYVVLGWSMSYCMQHKKLDDGVCTENSKFNQQQQMMILYCGDMVLDGHSSLVNI
jgi:hypothetical protein